MWAFDATAFADGALSVTVVTKAPSSALTTQPSVTITKDTAAPGAATVLSGTDAIISLNEISTATALTITPPAGDTISSVSISGTDLTSTYKSTNATLNTIGQWVFDATVFKDGVLTVTPTVVGVSGNTSSVASSLTLNSSFALAGGDSYINTAEAPAATSTAASTTPATLTTLTLLTPAGDTFTGFTVSGTLKTGRTTPTVNWTTGASTATFDATAFQDGTVTVNATTTKVPTGITATLTLDTVAPAGGSAPYISYMNYTASSGSGYIGSANANISTVGNAKTTNSTIHIYSGATGDFIVSATVSGVSSTTGLALTSSMNWANGLNGDPSFDSTKFANGQLVENTVWSDAAGNRFTQSTLMSMTSNGVAPTTHIANYIAPLNFANNSGTSYGQTQLAGATVGAFFPQATIAGMITGVIVEGITNSAGVTSATNPFFTAVMNASGGLDITASATGAGYGSVNLMATDASGNQIVTDFSVAVTNATVTVVTGTTTTDTTLATVAGATINAAGTLYDGSALTSTETYNISGTNTNSVIKGGTGSDIFILNNATLDFAQINGGANITANTGLDVVQLTQNYKSLDLSLFNHAGQQVIQQAEVIDMRTDTGADQVTLTPGDLFRVHSNQTDFVNTNAPTLTINGGTNDTVNLLTGGFVKTASTTDFTLTGATQGVADTTGTTAGYYSKYTATFNDTGGSHLVEVLIQHGVAVA
jgi:hypothetical protein